MSRRRASRCGPAAALTAARCLELFDAAARQPAPRRGRPLAAHPRHRLLHDRLVGARGQRRRGRGAPAHRPGAAALPVRRLLPGPGRPGRAAATTASRDVLLGLVGAADEPIAGGTAQGVRPPRPGRHPADLDDRLAPAAGRRPGLRARRGPPGSASPTPWPPTRSWWQLRRRVGQPLDRGRRASTPRPTAPTRACRCRCCSSARTTGIGISVRTPPGWVEAALGRRPGAPVRARRRHRPGRRLRRRRRAGRLRARARRTPAVLHLRTVRFGGHAGSDVESGLPQPAEIAADAERDPLLGTARLLVERRRC